MLLFFIVGLPVTAELSDFRPILKKKEIFIESQLITDFCCNSAGDKILVSKANLNAYYNLRRQEAFEDGRNTLEIYDAEGRKLNSFRGVSRLEFFPARVFWEGNNRPGFFDLFSGTINVADTKGTVLNQICIGKRFMWKLKIDNEGNIFGISKSAGSWIKPESEDAHDTIIKVGPNEKLEILFQNKSGPGYHDMFDFEITKGALIYSDEISLGKIDKRTGEIIFRVKLANSPVFSRGAVNYTPRFVTLTKDKELPNRLYGVSELPGRTAMSIHQIEI